MLNKYLFITSHNLFYSNFYKDYKFLKKNPSKKYDELLNEQNKSLRGMIKYSYTYVPFYNKLFKKLKLEPTDIKEVSDLEKLPVLNKEIIHDNWNDFIPLDLKKYKYYINSTGGTTGVPLKYRLSKNDRFYGGAMLYRGWGYGGYELGDKMVFLAGQSLDVGTQSTLSKKTHEICRNLKKLSSFDMGSEDMLNYVNIINAFKPKYVRGYPSSLFFLSNWIKNNDIKIAQLRGIFTTSEKLFPNMREIIEETFGCEVYDNYGLNDGGVSAYECSSHMGLHIDMERSVMEIVDDNNSQIMSGEGRILSTSLLNYSMPFIRYESGDIGHLITDTCTCGNNFKLLKEIKGRTVDLLITPEGKTVHGWFFLYIFWKYCQGIVEYQVVQDKIDSIVIKLVINDGFDPKQLDLITDIIRSKSNGWNVEFRYVDKIEKTKSGKHKFIINNLNR